jgi:spore coat protein A
MKQIFTSLKQLSVVFLFICFTFPVRAQDLLDPMTQPRFVNPLPVPSVIDGRNGGTFTVSMSQFYQDLGLRNPTTGAPMLTQVWGYDGSYPGPTILAKKDVPVNFFWYNNLYDPSTLKPLPHLLPIDTTIEWALMGEANWRQLGIPTVAHLHGGHTESASDGGPLAWYTPFFATKGSGFIKGQNVPYSYSNDQDAATLWYHDHAMGITRLNVYAGLAGFYVLTDDKEQQLKAQHKLPADPYDMALVIQDRMFTSDGQLFYPSNLEEQGSVSPSILPEFFGDFILVNGKAWPVLDVEPRQYRFRILNGSDSRFYNLFLSGNNSFSQIGSDQGLLPSPVPLNQMLIAPGERTEIVIDFSNPSLNGQTIILRNNAKTPYRAGKPNDPRTTGQIMEFRVNKPLNTNIPLSVLPASLLPSITPLVQNGPVRKLLLAESEDKFERIEPILGTVDGGAMDFDEPVTENIKLGDTEIWEFYNTTVDEHPIHLHLVKFQVISHQKFKGDVDPVTKKLTNIRLIGKPQLYNLDEKGWKDTHVVPAGEVTRVIAKFDRLGKYVWHCHILSHEDHDMMRPFIVTETGGSPTMDRAAAAAKIETEDKLQWAILPNPFNSNVSIQLNLAETKKVSIKLYDEKGGLVKQIYSGECNAGLQKWTINGSNMSNGIYFCEIVVNNVKYLRKLVLQK